MRIGAMHRVPSITHLVQRQLGAFISPFCRCLQTHLTALSPWLAPARSHPPKSRWQVQSAHSRRWAHSRQLKS